MEKVTKGTAKVEFLPFEEIEMMTEEDVIEGMEEKSIEEVIREVAEEEGLTEEEVKEMVERFQRMSFGVKKKQRNKPKRNHAKVKANKKQAKKSKRRNR